MMPIIVPSMWKNGLGLRKNFLCCICVIALGACQQEPEQPLLVPHDAPLTTANDTPNAASVSPNASDEQATDSAAAMQAKKNIPIAALLLPPSDESRPLNPRLADDSDIKESLALRNLYKKQFHPLERVIAIVIDDVGVDQQRSLQAVQIQGVYTISFLPYGQNLEFLTQLAQEHRHDIFIHQGAEPLSAADPGPGALKIGMDETAIRTQIQDSYQKLPMAVGISNHMGSRFTRWIDGVAVMLDAVQQHQLIYLDSFTDKYSQGLFQAAQKNYPALGRDVFIDGDNSVEAIHAQLRRTAVIAEQQGFAIAIGHPYDTTLKILPVWQEKLQADGFNFVTISQLWQLLTEKKQENN